MVYKLILSNPNINIHPFHKLYFPYNHIIPKHKIPKFSLFHIFQHNNFISKYHSYMLNINQLQGHNTKNNFNDIFNKYPNKKIIHIHNDKHIYHFNIINSILLSLLKLFNYYMKILDIYLILLYFSMLALFSRII